MTRRAIEFVGGVACFVVAIAIALAAFPHLSFWAIGFALLGAWLLPPG